MDRETFYTYFEKAFFSSKSQDIIKSKEAMMAHLGESEFIQNLLSASGRKDMLAFLDSEHRYDQWESLTEFFVENGIIMLDVTGYYKYLGKNSLEDLEISYLKMLRDFYDKLSNPACNLDDLRTILESQSERLEDLLYKCKV